MLSAQNNPSLSRLFTTFIMDIVFKRERELGLAIPQVNSLEEACNVLAETIEGWRTDNYDIGHSNGLLEGLLKGREEGFLEGETSGILKIARNLLAMRLSDQEIIQATGLSLEELHKLKEKS